MKLNQKQILKKYTIDDFLKLKPVIYEYCINLTATKNSNFWFRNTQKADDLYQDVFLYVYDHYFNKEKEKMAEGRFIQIMKNCTYWTFYKNSNSVKNHKIYQNINHYQDSSFNIQEFEAINSELPKLFQDIKEHPDYEFYMKNIKPTEREAIDKFLQGIPQAEVARIYNKNYAYVRNIIKKIEFNAKKEFFKKKVKQIPVRVKIKIEPIKDHSVFLKSKISNFDELFTNKKLDNPNKSIKQYSLYLQGYPQKEIAKQLNKSVGVVAQEIYRINKKVIKYGN